MSVNNRPNVAYCLNQPLASIFPAPIVSTRAPLSTDKAPLGTVWIQPSTNSAWILTSIVANSATWSDTSGGSGSFSTLTVTGDTTLASAAGAYFVIGNLSSATSLVQSGDQLSLLAAGTESDAILIGTSAGGIELDSVGAILLTSVAGNAAISLLSGTGAVNIGTDAVAKTVTVGNVTGATAVNINGGTGGINLAAAGIVTMTSTTPTAASPTASVTSNANVISATFTGFTTASASSQAFTITSSKITTSTPVIVTVSNLNASTNGALMGITGITQASGSIVVSTKNNGGGSLGSGDTVFVNVWVL